MATIPRPDEDRMREGQGTFYKDSWGRDERTPCIPLEDVCMGYCHCGGMLIKRFENRNGMSEYSGRICKVCKLLYGKP